MNRLEYKVQVNRTHSSAIIRKYFDMYGWLWWHIEALWLKPEDRRPFTMIWKDWIYPHMTWFLVFTAIWYTGMLAWMILVRGLSSTIACLVISTLSAFLWAHLRWSYWVPGEH